MIRQQERESQKGSLLVILPASMIIAVGLVAATLQLSTNNVSDARRETKKIQAYYVAKAGIERQILELRELTDIAVLVNAFGGVDALHKQRTYDNEILTVGTDSVGTYDVSVRIEGRPLDGSPSPVLSNSKRFITIRSTGWVPNRDDAAAQSHTLETTVLLELSASEVFDYAYFINNWGWFYGTNIITNGNVRSNGQFDCGNYSPTINGSPRYLGINGNDLYGYRDDNEDEVRDGSDGGIYAGWDIVGSSTVGGMAGTTVNGEKINQHEYSDQVDMPNLSNLALYEQHAIASNSSISIGGVQVCDAVCGDNVGEKQNLILIGTSTAPIQLNGTVVVRGAVIIKGKVTGRGVIYSGDNVYIADDLEYVNAPATARPADNSEATTETWLQSNQSRDALGLFAREHIILGDNTNSVFTSYVTGWVSNTLNQSKEDAGEDGIPNTRKGKDGILWTADDDFLEGDGIFSVDTYTAEMAAAGLIPTGKNVGDPIPGSGEDIDGDGVYDGTCTMAEFNIPASLSTTNWAGNLPAGTTALNQVATRYIGRIDAAMYTNHHLAGVILNYGANITLNGSIVSRNESIIYGANNLVMNHDIRLLGGGDNFGYYLPRTFESIRVMRVNDDVGNVHWDQITTEPEVNP